MVCTIRISLCKVRMCRTASNDVSSTSLALGADHAATLCDTPKGFSKIATATDEWNLVLGLVDVVCLIGDRQHLTLIDAIHADLLQNLSLHEVADARLCHHWDGDCAHD